MRREDRLKANGWPMTVSAYKVSKAVVNAYTRLTAKKFPSILVNCVHPGYCVTDITLNIGHLTPAEGAQAPVMVALLPDGGANKGIGLEICRQLASNGVMVVLTARDEKRGSEAVDHLKASGLCDVVFHQLDVTNPASIASSADYIKAKFGKLDILDVSNEWAKEVLSDADGLTEERIDEVVNCFLKDVREDLLEAKSWPVNLSAYTVSKAALNAYTRILAKKFPSFCINAVTPGYVKTDMSFNNGRSTVEEGAKGPVMLSLLPDGGPSGLFFRQMEESTF
ncbi:hypothetical protein RJ640_018859 [Escallonia rubra]|uniref:Uncharacterized protein n=1 Tax=Escallonia rubra TaxID=112253 RepID=A0AA88UKZ9_9ASTE|nr:hypothetical protein RJ640_018859 [Escallonia rubra]